MTKDIDPTSVDIVIEYVGPGFTASAPAADLSGNDLARLAWIAADKRPASPNDMKPAAIAEKRDELVATGFYKPVKKVTDHV